jgi:hypothetical protein
MPWLSSRPLRRGDAFSFCGSMAIDSAHSQLRSPITDSPWLWAALFTGVALAALLATGGKFGKRQANIENKYQARSAVASGTLDVQSDRVGVKTAARRPAYSTPEKQIIPLWPLEIILGAVCMGSVLMLLRQRFA